MRTRGRPNEKRFVVPNARSGAAHTALFAARSVTHVAYTAPAERDRPEVVACTQWPLTKRFAG
jgi:hypothetical protein